MIIKPENERVGQCRVNCGTPDAFPNLLIRNMKRLGLSSAEVVFLEYLISCDFTWKADCVVASSLKEMHRTTGLATGTIHAAKRGLVSNGLVQILNTKNKERTNTYNLLPLREKLAEFAEWRIPTDPTPKAETGDVPQQP
jgi:DNA-binding MarR family transcriptional regulator